MYDNHEDMRRYMEGTFINYKGSFLRVYEVSEDRLYCKNLTGGEDVVVFYDSGFKAVFPLGYVNTNSNAVYVRRIPGPNVNGCNYYKQGLYLNMLDKRLSSGMMKGLEECFLNQYPSISDAAYTATSQNRLIAFDRKLAIDGDCIIYSREIKVGVYTRGEVVYTNGVDNAIKEYVNAVIS